MPNSWSLDVKQCWVYIVFFLVAFSSSNRLFAHQNSQSGQPLAKLGSGALEQSQDAETDQSSQHQSPWGRAQCRKHSHCRKHPSGKPKCHQEYLGHAVTHV